MRVWAVTGILPQRSARFVFCVFAALCGCSLIEPREPEEPSQTGLDFSPPTDPTIVIANLQGAIDQKNLANYVSCFADPAKTSRPFTFVASAEARAQYPAILDGWSLDDERDYFQNMMAKTQKGAFSNLLLSLRSSAIAADSVTYSYDYVLTIEHTDPGIQRTARGNLQFTLGADRNRFWAIYRWIDFKTTSDVTWSAFKGKFGN